MHNDLMELIVFLVELPDSVQDYEEDEYERGESDRCRLGEGFVIDDFDPVYTRKIKNEIQKDAKRMLHLKEGNLSYKDKLELRKTARKRMKFLQEQNSYKKDVDEIEFRKDDPRLILMDEQHLHRQELL